MARRYRVRLLATAAPDYGEIVVALDGASAGTAFGLYSGRVCPTGSLELGQHDLAAGKHRLRCTVVRKNPASSTTSSLAWMRSTCWRSREIAGCEGGNDRRTSVFRLMRPAGLSSGLSKYMSARIIHQLI